MAEGAQVPNYLFILAPFTFVFTRRGWLVWLALLSTGCWIALASVTWTARYFLPIYPGLTILSAFALTSLADRFGRRLSAAVWLPCVALAVVLGLVVYTCTGSISRTGTWRFITGASSRREFMSARSYYPPLDFINHNVPQSEMVMMMGAQMSYDLKSHCIADPAWDSIEWQRLLIRNSTLDEVNENLKRDGVTHILYRPVIFPFLTIYGHDRRGALGTQVRRNSQQDVGRVADYEPEVRTWSTFEMYKLKYLETVREYDGYTILRIK